MNFNIPTEAIDHFKNVDEILYTYINNSSKPDRSINPNYFDELVRSIIYQQVSMKAGNTIYNRLINLMEIAPDNIINMNKDELQSIGVSYRKVDYLKNLSNHVLDKTVDLDIVDSLTDKEVIDMITKVKGLGVWSAEMFLMFALGRLDVSSYNDLAIKKGIKILYKLDNIPTKKEFTEFVKKWSPYNTIAHFYLWQISVEGVK